MIEDKINNFFKAPNESINLGDITKLHLSDKVFVYWGDEKIGFLKKGDNIFSPKAEVISTEFLKSEKKTEITIKLQKWLEEKISTTLKPITQDLDHEISSSVRTIAFNLFNSLGTMVTQEFKHVVKTKPRQVVCVD